MWIMYINLYIYLCYRWSLFVCLSRCRSKDEVYTTFPLTSLFVTLPSLLLCLCHGSRPKDSAPSIQRIYGRPSISRTYSADGHTPSKAYVTHRKCVLHLRFACTCLGILLPSYSLRYLTPKYTNLARCIAGRRLAPDEATIPALWLIQRAIAARRCHALQCNAELCYTSLGYNKTEILTPMHPLQ